MPRITYKNISLVILMLGYLIGLVGSANTAKSYVPFTARYIDGYVQTYPLGSLMTFSLFILLGYGFSFLVIHLSPANKRPCLYMSIASFILFTYNLILALFSAMHMPNYFASFNMNNFMVAIILLLFGMIFFVHQKLKEIA